MSKPHVKLIQSKADDKSYRYIILENEMKVLLISDPTTDKGCAGINVQIGSNHDPDNIDGLAHFLEHMLFLGSEKYPGQNEYSEYLSTNGGSSNAFTASEYTHYYFETRHDCLTKTLDMMAQFFISPLFTRELVDREMNAVNSEYAMNLQSDDWKRYQLQKSLADPEHRYHKFCIGNLETLKIEGIVDTLIKFYEETYSSNLMNLVVLGQQSLNELEQMTRTSFNDVKNKNTSPLITHNDTFPFSKNRLNKIVYQLPIQENHTLILLFQLPPLSKEYRTKPDNCLSHLIGHEGEGSLLNKLKQLGYAESLYAGPDDQSLHNPMTLFSIHVSLTEKGLENYKEVIEYVFGYIQMLKDAESSNYKYIYEETKHLSQIKFDTVNKQKPNSCLSLCCNNMLFYDPEDILYGPYKFDDYSDSVSKNIKKLINDYFNPDDMLVFLASPSVSELCPNFDTDKKTERWMLSEYLDVDLGFTFDSASDKKNSFHLPMPNEFIPENLDLLVQKPILLRQTPYEEIWYKPDYKFKKPISYVNILFCSPSVSENKYTAKLFCSAIDEELNCYAYNALLVDMTYSVNVNENGINVICQGYSDKLMILLEKVLDKILSVSKEFEATFDLCKEKMLRQLKNKKLEPVSEMINNILSEIYEETCVDVDRAIQLVKNIKYIDMLYFRNTWASEMYVKYLVQGNIREQKVIQIADSIKQEFKYMPWEPSQPKYIKDRNITINTKSHDSNNVNSGTLKYLIVDATTPKEVSTLCLLGGIMTEPFFDRLRTNENLGYHVYCNMYRLTRIYGLYMFVVSDVKDPIFLNTRMNNFLSDFGDALKAITPDKLKEYIDGFKTISMPVDTKLSHETSRNAAEISIGRYAFDARERIGALVETVTVDDLINLHKKILANPNSITINIFNEISDVEPTDHKYTYGEYKHILTPSD